MPYKVEPATPGDWIAIAHLNVWAWREFSMDLGPEAWPEVVRTLTTADPTADFMVIREEGGLVGSVAYRRPGSSLGPVPAAWASVGLLAVSPAARREGVGRALVMACIERARSEGAGTIGAGVGSLMTAAQSLFSGLGFHREQGLARRNAPPHWLYRLQL